MTKSSLKLRKMIVASLFAAIISILAQVSIPLPLGVPITGQTLAIGLAATILGSKHGTLSTLLYLMIGAVGIPVFAQMTGGFGVLVGPTGGFLIGFIPASFIIGFYLEKTSFTIKNALIANVIGMFISLIFGTVWLKIVSELSWNVALTAGFTPFIIGGFIKVFIASWAGIIIRERLKTANLLEITI